jgi:hypothetical protein
VKINAWESITIYGSHLPALVYPCVLAKSDHTLTPIRQLSDRDPCCPCCLLHCMWSETVFMLQWNIQYINIARTLC